MVILLVVVVRFVLEWVVLVVLLVVVGVCHSASGVRLVVVSVGLVV